MVENLNRSLMKKFYSALTILWLLVQTVFGQISITPEEGFDVDDWFPGYPTVGAFDFSDTLFYLNDGDTIHQLDINSGAEMNKFGVPEDYSVNHYVSFLTVSPDGGSIWTGYTSDGNMDDRIYSIDVESGEWRLCAIFPGNMDLEFWKDSILVSGLNSTSWDAPSAIFVLDTSGGNHHRRIIEPGGYSTGLAIDQQGNIYYGTSFASAPNVLYRWDHATVKPVIEIPGKVILNAVQGEKLSDLPGGAYDCDIDDEGNLLFNMNLYGGNKVVAMWNGNPGDGNNIDTLASASGEWDWLGILKSRGDMTLPGPDNMVVTFCFGQPLALLTRKSIVGLQRRFETQISLFPNPSPGIFTIHYEGTGRRDVKIYTLQGSLVHSEKDIVPGAVIDITPLPRGSYIVGVSSGQEITSRLIQKL
jgi:hypothetical protein